MKKQILIFLIFISIDTQASEGLIIETEKKISQLNTDVTANNNKIIQTKKNTDVIKQVIESKQRYLSRRIMAHRQIQKFNWQGLLNSSDKSVLERNLKIFKNVNSSDIVALEELQLKKAELKYYQERLSSENSKIMQMIRELKKTEEKLVELENQQILELKKRKQEQDSFLPFKNTLVLPIDANIRWRFGYRFDEKLQFSLSMKGLVFDSAADQIVHAFGPGQVIFSDQIPYWGDSLIVSHKGGYYSVYSGVKNVKVKINDFVESRQELASAKDQNFYFEFRHQDVPVNPAKWIRKDHE